MPLLYESDADSTSASLIVGFTFLETAEDGSPVAFGSSLLV
jgi:hypothetical protein